VLGVEREEVLAEQQSGSGDTWGGHGGPCQREREVSPAAEDGGGELRGGSDSPKVS
jgi:hypothetical protein